MTTITRVNAKLNDHAAIANAAALTVLVVACMLSAAAIVHSGNLAKTAYDSFAQPATVAQVPATQAATAAQTTPLTITSPASIQAQSPQITAQLQPAANSIQISGATVQSLQPAANGIQLTDGNNLQRTVTIL